MSDHVWYVILGIYVIGIFVSTAWQGTRWRSIGEGRPLFYADDLLWPLFLALYVIIVLVGKIWTMFDSRTEQLPKPPYSDDDEKE